MAKKFRPGNHVMLKKGGIPMLVTMYTVKGENLPNTLCVTWTTLEGKTKTAKFHEDELVLFPRKEWNGKPLEGLG